MGGVDQGAVAAPLHGREQGQERVAGVVGAVVVAVEVGGWLGQVGGGRAGAGAAAYCVRDDGEHGRHGQADAALEAEAPHGRDWAGDQRGRGQIAWLWRLMCIVSHNPSQDSNSSGNSEAVFAVSAAACFPDKLRATCFTVRGVVVSLECVQLYALKREPSYNNSG